ncbi:tRNA (5-methylaminomethyl-2-thiouridine)(34)-methyltransferase MnmD [Flagellimonas sp. HMM57]|uniref:tRNA (5-methylaminomethyl-2-thiouridine)(34)-methyltransferase MnmD n=1 Tax=unclassified Flagellimonas TaxID=2644544 RepID=UPI0013D86D47|nr:MULTISPECIES: tRNA (5-methylaminomethyl-2-thiouridine)(34)-methyltransferase MnmD [unclassified Flagellimonas]UII75117.1 tRNA (5-methylaminomethyl-2-thiouridine)(34)-methyltransferase MnmD [Flagellimonas sp. HMM57]
MKRKIITTADGSKTIQIEDWDEQYHSKHGAVQEAYHVFIQNGLRLFQDRCISILEVGFGTGLNAFITYLESVRLKLSVEYIGVEAFPVKSEEIAALNYIENLNAHEHQELFEKMHSSSWETKTKIAQNFELLKQLKDFKSINDANLFNLVYYDAFGARVQPDLWTEELFLKMYSALKKDGVLVTYSAKGSVRRALEAVGFSVERLPGPPGKREMLRATKI